MYHRVSISNRLISSEATERNRVFHIVSRYKCEASEKNIDRLKGTEGQYVVAIALTNLVQYTSDVHATSLATSASPSVGRSGEFTQGRAYVVVFVVEAFGRLCERLL